MPRAVQEAWSMDGRLMAHGPQGPGRLFCNGSGRWRMGRLGRRTGLEMVGVLHVDPALFGCADKYHVCHNGAAVSQGAVLITPLEYRLVDQSSRCSPRYYSLSKGKGPSSWRRHPEIRSRDRHKDTSDPWEEGPLIEHYDGTGCWLQQRRSARTRPTDPLLWMGAWPPIADGQYYAICQCGTHRRAIQEPRKRFASAGLSRNKEDSTLRTSPYLQRR